MMGDSAFWVILALLGAAAFVQSATGFGLAMVCMAGLPLVMPIREATSLTAVLNLFVCAGVILFNWRGFGVKSCLPLIVAICVGIPIGYYGLRSFDEVWVVRILGVILILIVLFEIIFSSSQRFTMPKQAGVPICVLGGILGGAFNVGGPPIVAYIYSQNTTKISIVTSLQTIFLASGLVRNGLMIKEGDTTWHLLKLILLSLPAVVLGIWLGKIVLDRTPMIWLKRVVFAGVFCIGVYYITGSTAK